MKILQLVLVLITVFSCKNKEVKQEILPETSCLLKSYNNSAGFLYKLKYDSEKVSEWTISYVDDFFEDSVTNSYNFIYNSFGNSLLKRVPIKLQQNFSMIVKGI